MVGALGVFALVRVEPMTGIEPVRYGTIRAGQATFVQVRGSNTVQHACAHVHLCALYGQICPYDRSRAGPFASTMRNTKKPPTRCERVEGKPTSKEWTVNNATQTSCPQCRRPVADGVPRHSVTHPAGSRAGLVHSDVTSTWHRKCWAEAESFVADSRARAEADSTATIRAICEAHGLPVPDEAGVRQ